MALLPRSTLFSYPCPELASQFSKCVPVSSLLLRWPITNEPINTRVSSKKTGQILFAKSFAERNMRPTVYASEVPMGHVKSVCGQHVWFTSARKVHASDAVITFLLLLYFPPRGQGMDYRCRLGSLGKSSTASRHRDPRLMVGLEL